MEGAEYGITSNEVFALKQLPKRIAVVGAGYIAVELAGVFNGLGVDTHLFVRRDRPLRTFDRDMVDTLVEVMEKEGPKLHTQAIPKKVMWHASQISESLKLYANDYGFTFGDVEFDFSKLVDNRSAYIDRIHGSYERGLNTTK